MMPITESTENVAKTTISKTALALKSPTKGARIPFLCLPAAAKCPVELHETLVFVASRLRQREFCGKKGPLTVQHFEISGGAKRRAFADGDAGAIGVDDGADHHYIEYFGRLTTLIGTMRERSYSCFLSRLCN